MQKKVSFLTYVSAVFISGIVLHILFFNFYKPTKESKFVQKVEAELNATGKDYVRLSNITNFDWDTVCYVTKYSIPSPIIKYFFKDTYDLSIKDTAERYEIGIDELAENFSFLWWPGFNGAHFFIHDGKVVEKLIYNSRGLRFKDGHLQAYFHMTLNGEKVFYLDEVGFSPNKCVSNEVAVLSVQDDPEKTIILTHMK